MHKELYASDLERRGDCRALEQVNGGDPPALPSESPKLRRGECPHERRCAGFRLFPELEQKLEILREAEQPGVTVKQEAYMQFGSQYRRRFRDSANYTVQPGYH